MTDDGLGRAVGRRGFLTGAASGRCGMRLLSSSTVVALALAGPARAQITENPLPEPIEKRGLVGRDPRSRAAARHARAAPRRPGRDAAGWARVSFVRDLARRPSLRERLARVPLSGRRTTRPRSTWTSGRVSARDLQPARERIHRLRVPSGVRDERPFLHRAREKGPGNPARPDFIPPGSRRSDVTYHNVITEWHARDPAANVRSRARGASCCASATSSPNLTHP